MDLRYIVLKLLRVLTSPVIQLIPRRMSAVSFEVQYYSYSTTIIVVTTITSTISATSSSLAQSLLVSELFLNLREQTT